MDILLSLKNTHLVSHALETAYLGLWLENNWVVLN